MALLCIGTINDNVSRANLRAACRATAATPEGYLVLTLGDRPEMIPPSLRNATAETLGFDPAKCGWFGKPIRPFPSGTNGSEVLDGYQPASGLFALRSTVGGCQEYAGFVNFDEWSSGDGGGDGGGKGGGGKYDEFRSNASAQQDDHGRFTNCMLPRGPFGQCENELGLLVDTPDSLYCFASSTAAGTSDTSAWLQFGALLLFLCWLIRLRRLVCLWSRMEDDAIISTADYALQISGLDRKLEADDLQAQLKTELEELEDEHGSFAGTIHHIEVGRHCEDEIKVLNEMHRMDVEAGELSERKAMRLKANAPTADLDKKLQSLAKRYEVNKERMVKLVEEPDMATGHAFVVFNYEKDRNRLARLFTSTPRSLYMFLRPSKRRTSSATLKCAEPVVESWMPSCSEMVSPFFWCRCLLAKGGLVEADVKTSVVVTSAPEPNEVLWENLQIDDEAEARVETISSGIVFVLIVVGILMLVLIKILQIMFVDFLSQRDGWNWMVKLFLKNIATIAVATVTLTWNFLSREIILKMTKRAGHDTATAEESAVFAKLSWAYVFNSVVIPLFIFGMLTASSPNSGGALIDQTWFEENSIITTAAMLIVCNYITDLMKVANPFPILMRYGFGRYAMSQTKQNELWKPMPFHTGVQYSLIFKSVSLGLVYGPIWPPAYLLTSIGLALSWICTRFGLRHWYRCPANVQGGMMLRMRWRLGNVLGLAVVVQCIAVVAASSPDSLTNRTQMLVLVSGPLALFVYALLPLGAFKNYSLHDEVADAQDEGEGEQDGGGGGKEKELAFDEVTKARGFDMPRYCCPLVGATSLMFSKAQTGKMALSRSGSSESDRIESHRDPSPGSPEAAIAAAMNMSNRSESDTSSPSPGMRQTAIQRTSYISGDEGRKNYSLGHQASFVLNKEGLRATSRETNAPVIVMRRERKGKKRATGGSAASPVRNENRVTLDAAE